METINLDPFYIYCVTYNTTDVRIDTRDVLHIAEQFQTKDMSFMTVGFTSKHSHGDYKDGHLQVLEQAELSSKETAQKAYDTMQLIFQVAAKKHHDCIVIPFNPSASAQRYAELYAMARRLANGTIKTVYFSCPPYYVDMLSHTFYNI